MAIPPITPASAGLATGELTGATRPAAPGFGDAIAKGIQAVSDAEHTADAAIQDFATGGSTGVTELMAATAKASLSVELLGVVRDRAIEAYQEIMRMQV